MFQTFPAAVDKNPLFDQTLFDAIQPAEDALRTKIEAATTIPELQAAMDGTDAVANPEASEYFDALDAFTEALVPKVGTVIDYSNDLTGLKITISDPGITSSTEL